MINDYRRKQLRVFCPVILYHSSDWQPEGHNECDYTGKDNQDYQFVKAKKRAEETLNEGSQYWQRIYENSRDSVRQQHYDRTMEMHSTPTSPMLNASIYTHHSQDGDGTLHLKPAKRRRGNLPKATTALLKSWLAQHKKHPYPTEEEKLALAKETKLNLQQISNWFINARRRHLPHLLESDYPNGGINRNGGELDIYPYEAEPADDDSGRVTLRRVSEKKCRVTKSVVPKYSRRRKQSM